MMTDNIGSSMFSAFGMSRNRIVASVAAAVISSGLVFAQTAETLAAPLVAIGMALGASLIWRSIDCDASDRMAAIVGSMFFLMIASGLLLQGFGLPLTRSSLTVCCNLWTVFAACLSWRLGQDGASRWEIRSTLRAARMLPKPRLIEGSVAAFVLVLLLLVLLWNHRSEQSLLETNTTALFVLPGKDVMLVVDNQSSSGHEYRLEMQTANVKILDTRFQIGAHARRQLRLSDYLGNLSVELTDLSSPGAGPTRTLMLTPDSIRRLRQRS